MKYLICIFFQVVLLISTTAQNLFYEMRASYDKAITPLQLKDCNTLGDIMKDYPSNWISSYIDVSLSTDNQGIIKCAHSKNDTLTNEQKDLLFNAELETKITLKIDYLYKNAATNNMENNSMDVTFTVVPEYEAEFQGGKNLLTAYIKTNAIDKLPITNEQVIQPTNIHFTINKVGNIIDVKLLKSSGSSIIDNTLIETINKMPKWKAARQMNGQNVKQKFEFRLSNAGC